MLNGQLLMGSQPQLCHPKKKETISPAPLPPHPAHTAHKLITLDVRARALSSFNTHTQVGGESDGGGLGARIQAKTRRK